MWYKRVFGGQNAVLLSIVFLGVVLRASWMLRPNYYYSVDEVYYVPAALHYLSPLDTNVRDLVRLFTEDRYAPYYINPEHPPLAKLVMALGVFLFGNNALGWRFFSTLFGSLGMVAVYLAAKKTSPSTTLMATAIYAFYPIEVSMNQIGMLDVFSTTLLGFSFAALVNHRPRLAAFLLGLSTAAKLTGIVGWLPLIYYLLIHNRGIRNVLRALAVELAVFYLSFVVWFLPMMVYYGFSAAILDQYYMVAVQGDYGAGPGVLTPIMWLFSFTQPTFNPTVFVNNPLLTALSIPALAYSVTQLRRDDRAILVLALFLASYGFIVVTAAARPIYFYYFEDAAPALAILAGYFLEGLLSTGKKAYRFLAYGLFAATIAVSALTVPVVLYGGSVPYTKILIRLSY